MPRLTKEREETQKTLVLNALLVQPSVSKVAEVTGIKERRIYDLLQDETFKQELAEARNRITEETINYLQGNLKRCEEVLMKIVNDEEASQQVRINAINTAFNHYKGLTTTDIKTIGMAVQIVDDL